LARSRERLVDVGRRPVRPVEPDAHRELGKPLHVAGLEQRLLLRVGLLHLLRPVPVGKACRDEDERLDAVGVDERELERDAPADRDADHSRALDPQPVEQAREVAHVRVRTGRKGRAAVPGEVVADHAVPIGQRRHVLVPHRAVRDPLVNEHERRAAARLLVPELLPADVCERHGASVLW
jgi:hypothetical protein